MIVFTSKFLTTTSNLHKSSGNMEALFIPVYHFYPFPNIQGFICSLVSEMTTSYFLTQHVYFIKMLLELANYINKYFIES